ncbi:MAG: Hsp70 family protein [Phaeospirillum sp.]|nr:Hsp70 family protein [Phaeospirillum sp.]
MHAKKVFGIDLGTTYSCISYVDEHGKPVVIPNSEGTATTPSVVYFESQSSIVVGQTAKDVAKVEPDLVVQSVKRHMGDPHWIRGFHGKDYRPQEISALILRKVVGDAERETGERVEDVVITCPAYFGTNEREATRQAGILAGLNVHYVIPEPTAAAIAYGVATTEEQVILVYDLGGGTFDVTLVRVTSQAIEVLATGGDRELGGKDWDDAIVAHFANRFQEEAGVSPDDLLGNAEIYQELINDAERAKVTLSTRSTYKQKIRFGMQEATIELSREDFHRITASLLERTISLTRDILGRAQEHKVTVDTILLVGGSTYMPQVEERLGAEFPYRLLRSDPNQIVAKGAALFGLKCQLEQEIKITIADRIGGDAASVNLDTVPNDVKDSAQAVVAKRFGMALPGLLNRKVANVSSKSFGLVVVDLATRREVVSNLVVVDQPVPIDVTRNFGTVDDNQDGVSLQVMENLHRSGEDAFVELPQCTEIGSAQLTFLRPLPESSPIEITFMLTADGLLRLTGRDLTTGQEIKAEFKAECIMSAEEMNASQTHIGGLAVS